MPCHTLLSSIGIVALLWLLVRPTIDLGLFDLADYLTLSLIYEWTHYLPHTKERSQIMSERSEVPFWKRKSLQEMTPQEWEALCDGCGRCCLHKFEFEDTGELVESRIACRLLDPHTCRCKSYRRRHQLVDDCLSLTPENIATMDFLPSTCAYRRLARGQDLAWWHPLVSGTPQTVHEARVSVRGRRLISEDCVPPEDFLELDDAYLLEWDD